MHGKFVWCDYVSNDARKAQGFFAEVFAWSTKTAQLPRGSYTMIANRGDTIGGYSEPTEAKPHAHWLVHLAVDDAHASAEQVTSHGGRVVMRPMQVGEHGTMAIVCDPCGAEFALWQAARPLANNGDYTGADGNWIWTELYTSDFDRTLAFYTAIGHFEVQHMAKKRDAPGPDRYEILATGGKGVAGVMHMPGAPQMWMPYVKAANVDQTVERAKRLGADIKHAPETLPNVGRLAVFGDPLGVPTGVLLPAPNT